MAAANNAKRNDGDWRERSISTLADVSSALAYLDLPGLSEEVLSLIGNSNSKGKFKSSLLACARGKAQGHDVPADTKRYIVGLVRTLSGVTNDLLIHLGYAKIAPEVLLYIGELDGLSFYNALAAAANKEAPNREMGCEFVEMKLRAAFDHFDMPWVGESPIEAAIEQPRQLNSEEGSSRLCRDEDEAESSAFFSTHVYGGKSAICFNAAKARKGDHYAVIVDGAAALSDRKYDWKNAVKIQLGYKELPLLYGVLAGWSDKVKFEAHGSTNDKAFEFERQNGKFFAKVIGKDRGRSVARAVPVGPMDAYPIMMLVLGQIVKDAPKELQGSPTLIIQMMRAAQNIKTVQE